MPISPASADSAEDSQDSSDIEMWPVMLISVHGYQAFPLRTGDNLVTISHNNSRDTHVLGHNPNINLFLPGSKTSDTDIWCTISLLCDGSILLHKEKNGGPEIFLNGMRVPSGSPMSLKARDTLVLGSLEYTYILDLQDDSDESSLDSYRGKRTTNKGIEDVATEILLSGDLDCRIEDMCTGQLLSLGNDYNLRLINSIRGISVFAFQAQEMVDWMRFFGLSAQHILKIDVDYQSIDLQIRTTLDFVHVQPAVKLQANRPFHSVSGGCQVHLIETPTSLCITHPFHCL